MKLLVLSDSHGRSGQVRAAMALHPDAGAVLFLGDGLRDLPDASPCPIYAVRGNCDAFTMFDLMPAPDERVEVFGGYRVLALHGHTRGAKAGTVRLIGAALEQGADLVCFGHTHEPFEQYIPAGETRFGAPLEKPLWLFNPGSINAGSFGLIELRPGGVLLSHGQL